MERSARVAAKNIRRSVNGPYHTRTRTQTRSNANDAPWLGLLKESKGRRREIVGGVHKRTTPDDVLTERKEQCCVQRNENKVTLDAAEEEGSKRSKAIPEAEEEYIDRERKERCCIKQDKNKLTLETAGEEWSERSEATPQAEEEYIDTGDSEYDGLIRDFQKVTAHMRLAVKAQTREIECLRDEIDRMHSESAAAVTREEEKETCKICFNAPRNTVILPCGAFEFCNGCVQILVKDGRLCPTCRGSIDGFLRVQNVLG